MKRRLLIVDDENAVRTLLSRILTNAGHDCSVAENALSARELLKTRVFDLILCDILMPGESGLDLIRFCAKEYPDMGNILVTGVEDPQSAEEALNIGAYGYVIKPFTNNQLLIIVNNALRRCALEREHKRHAEELESIVHERTVELQEAIRRLEAAKDKIQESEEKFRMAIEQANDGIAIAQKGKHAYVNKNLLKMFGYERAEEIIGRSLNILVHPDETVRLTNMHNRRMKGRKVPNRYKYKGIRKSGDPIMVEVSVAHVDFQGEDASLAFLRDVTESTRVQTALKESEKRLKAILENAPVGIKIVDAEDRKIVDINRAGEKMIGLSRKEIIGRPCSEFACPESKDFCPVMDAGKKIKNLETTISKPDGQRIDVSKTSVPLVLEGRKYLIDIFVNISRHKRAVAEMRKTHREKEQLIKSIPSILIGVTSEGLVSHFNPVSERVFGINASEILYRPFSHCGIRWDWVKVEQAISDCLNRRTSVSGEKLRFTGKDGTEGFLGLTFTPVASDGENGAGFLLIGADITNRIMLELQLDQARKLEAIGQLAAGIAHEINTPTQYVGDNIRFFQDAFNDMKPIIEHYKALSHKLPEEGISTAAIAEMKENIATGDLDYLLEEIPQALEQTLEGVGRVSTIVRSMKEFSHPGAKEKTGVDINRAIENTTIVSRNEWKYVARLETDLDPSLPHVSCFPAEVNQVILNMITNAAHAIGDVVESREGEKGKIGISTRTHGDFVEIRISDTGPGIPEEIQTRIFDPFFTTKEVGKGTGQGLTISHSIIVDKHGGTLSFETKKGEGTSFYIHLPIE
jgi:two-component system, NtrC family, sensor kinase